MSIYTEALERVENGETFHIDFEKRTMKIGRDKIIDNGEYDTSKVLHDYEICDPQDVLYTIKELYRDYKYSLPSERNDNKRRKYFKALPVNELTDKQMMFGMAREVAQFMLEAFVLCAILNGDFVWDEELHGKWFYQCPTDSDLIILRSWVEGK